jgi:hypothetical protein
MKKWIPILGGFIAGVIAGVVYMPHGGSELAQKHHETIRSILYPGQDPMAGLLYDPLAIILIFGLIGAFFGVVWVLFRYHFQWR